jgi:hypothetical protein
MDDPLAQKQFAMLLVAVCVRNSYLETLHAGKTPISNSGDYSDVTVDANGRIIPWNEVSRINDDEMKTLMMGVVDQVYTFLMRTIFDEGSDEEFIEAVEYQMTWVKNWATPQFLEKFCPPVGR